MSEVVSGTIQAKRDEARPRVRVGVLGSTRGTALQGVLEAIAAGELNAKLVLVVSDRASAGILERAAGFGVPVRAISAKGKERTAFDAEVTEAFEHAQADVLLMVGYMRIVSREFVDHWRGRLLNVHPSLLPAFAGMMDLHVHEAVLAAGVKETGCTVHHVTEEVDAGPVVLQKRCPVLPGDTAEALKARVQSLEQQAFVEVLQKWSRT